MVQVATLDFDYLNQGWLQFLRYFMLALSTPIVFMAIIGIFLAGALYSATNNGYMSLVGFTLPMTIGLYFRAPTISAMFGLIVIMGAFAIWYMIRKVPQ